MSAYECIGSTTRGESVEDLNKEITESSACTRLLSPELSRDDYCEEEQWLNLAICDEVMIGTTTATTTTTKTIATSEAD